MVFVPPSWAPGLPDLPDNITLEEFVTNEAHGRCPFAKSRNPFTCGITGLTRNAADVAKRIDLLARGVANRLNFKPSQGTAWDRVVAVYALNTIDYVTLTLAMHRLSAIPTPASAAYSSSELEFQLRASEAKAIFTCLPLLENARAAARAVGIPDNHIFLLPLPSDPVPSTCPSVATVDDLVAEGETLPPVEPLNWAKGQGARQVAFLCYSSGTSGLPKAVMISHFNVMTNMTQICLADARARKQLGFETQTLLSALPLSHIYGLVMVSLLGFYCGDQCIVLPKFELEPVLAAIGRFRIEQLNVVPPMLIQVITNREKCARYDLGSVRWLFCGAAPLGTEVLDKLLKMYPSWKVGQGYGMTEASPCATYTNKTDFLPGSSGCLLPGFRAKLIDENGNEVTTYETRGEMYLQSPSIALGYLNNKRATAETFVWHHDGRWLRTGDELLVRKADSGTEHFVVTDRIKELIKVKGYQVAPAELEAHLHSHPFVADCAVISVPDERAGEVPKAFIARTPEALARARAAGANRETVDAEMATALARHVEEHKARYKWLRGGIEFVNVVPRSPSGKILRRLLRDREARRRKGEGAKL